MKNGVENYNDYPLENPQPQQQQPQQQQQQPRQKKSRLRTIGFIALIALPFLFALAVALVLLIPSITTKSSGGGGSSNAGQISGTSTSIHRLLQGLPALNITLSNTSLSDYPHLTESPLISSHWGAPNPNTTTLAPTVSPTTSSPTLSPSMIPSAAPTIPEMGCVADIGKRDGDRFDNEGNQEWNSRLFAGQFVCSTAFAGSSGTRQYQFGIDPATGDLIVADVLENTRRTYYTNDFHRTYLRQQEAERQRRRLEGGSLVGNNSSGAALNSTTNDTINDTNSSFVNTNMTTPSNDTAARQSLAVHDEDTVLNYYFSLSTEAAFRIHRVQRTEDYQVLSEALLWELPSTYTISSVYENCLYTHDCPYMHLHRDGVMVLAWLDFDLSPYYDGWMEKNIRGCYDFNTTDKL